MMYFQTRKKKFNFPFSSFFSSSLNFSLLHFPLNLNCQTNLENKKAYHSEAPNSGASSSSSPPHGEDYEGKDEQWKGNDFEVFLSFREKDTGKGFTDYLYTSLVDAGIRVFKDDNELYLGEEIGPKALNCLVQSQISIPIISENYTSSKWCLCELAQMLKCRRSRGQIVLPIFYRRKAFEVPPLARKHGYFIKRNKDHWDEKIVKEWEEALAEIRSLHGWESENIDDGHEGTLVKIVVGKVINELTRCYQLMVPKQLVGIDAPMEEIMSLIDFNFYSTMIIGIYGMNDIGKTTLAKVLYNKLSSHFEHTSFVANIQERSLREGTECLQKQLIYDILRSPHDVSNVDQGVSVIASRFTNKRVLILLDDMDDKTHLNALVGDGSWFKAGSIVIITTRNKRILDKVRTSYVYQLKELPFDKSLILFSRHAFEKDSPQSDYEALSHDVVSIIGGIPSALEFIGSFLYGERQEVWKATLKKLNKVPHQKVREKLKRIMKH